MSGVWLANPGHDSLRTIFIFTCSYFCILYNVLLIEEIVSYHKSGKGVKARTGRKKRNT